MVGAVALRQDLMDHASRDIGESLLTSIVGEREQFVVETKEVKNGRVQIVHVDLVGGGA
mgnify:CR=1 FL=1